MLHHCRGADMAAMENVSDCRGIPLPVYELTDEAQDLLPSLGCLSHIYPFRVSVIVQMYYYGAVLSRRWVTSFCCSVEIKSVLESPADGVTRMPGIDSVFSCTQEVEGTFHESIRGNVGQSQTDMGAQMPYTVRTACEM